MSRYKIKILTLQGRTLHFTVSKYEITEGDFVEFIDEVTGRELKFHASRCEFEVIQDGGN
jgi:hypothetical protein